MVTTYKIALRKVFNLQNEKQFDIVEQVKHSKFKQPVSASGCLFYKIQNNTLYLLLISYTNEEYPLYDDLGGKIDLNDYKIINCATRETEEETNNVITKNATRTMINDSTDFKYYNKQCKYFGYVVDIGNKYDFADFGNDELVDNIGRTIQFYDYKNVREKLAMRMSSSKELMEFLDGVQSMLDND